MFVLAVVRVCVCVDEGGESSVLSDHIGEHEAVVHNDTLRLATRHHWDRDHIELPCHSQRFLPLRESGAMHCAW